MDRRDRLATYLDSHELESIWFARPDAFTWLTGGSNLVDRTAATGVAAVGFDGDWQVVVDSIEAARIAAEELPAIDADVTQFDWYDRTLPEAIASVASEPAAADIDVSGFDRVDPTPLRVTLSDRDRAHYRELGREVAEAVESVCREVTSTDTETEVAAALQIALTAREIEPTVVLVGGEDRAQRYRHYTSTDTELGGYVLASVTARRDGLYASCTRTVAFDPPPWLESHNRVAASVETTAIAATRAGVSTSGTAGDVFEAIRNAYAAHGHPEEWRKHHQGGATGFAGREWFATPEHEAALTTPTAYAWNPTVQGAKSEDTVLITDDEIEILTETGNWPQEAVDAIGYDHSLDRPRPLERPDASE